MEMAGKGPVNGAHSNPIRDRTGTDLTRHHSTPMQNAAQFSGRPRGQQTFTPQLGMVKLRETTRGTKGNFSKKCPNLG